MNQLEVATDAIAIAISQVHRQTHASMERQNLINQLILAIHQGWGLEEILQLAVKGVVQGVQVDRGLVLLLKYIDPLPRSLEKWTATQARVNVAYDWFAPASNPPELEALEQNPALSACTHQSFWLTDSPLCQAAISHAPQFILKATLGLDSADPSIANSPLSSLEAVSVFKLRYFPALLMAPLMSQGTILGFLVLQAQDDRGWLANDIALVELVAAQITTAIIQTQTLRQVQALVEERTAQLQRSLELQAKLYEKTRDQIAQLQRLNHLKDEFLSTVSHELLTPLTSMSLAIRMLREATLSPERQHRYLDILEQQCVQETTLINNLLALQQLEGNLAPLVMERTNLHELIHQLSQEFEKKWTPKPVKLVSDLPPRTAFLETDLKSLSQILLELLTNAGKYAEPHTTVSLHLALQLQQPVNQIQMKVTNTGQGIPPEEVPYIFDKFRRGQGVTQQAVPGTGLGLALVKYLVEHLNGELVASSQPLETGLYETCFTLTLPQTPSRASA